MYSEKPNNTKQKVAAGVVVILAAVLLTIVANVSASRSDNQTAQVSQSPITSTAPSSPTASTTSSPASTTSYKDGTYTASSEYYVPHGYEDIKVTVTVKSGVITDSNIVNSESDRESQIFQENFASVYKSYVVGKNLDGLNLSYVAGASDTTQGFNDAITTIQNQAKA